MICDAQVLEILDRKKFGCDVILRDVIVQAMLSGT
jgi:hypothetical protein